MPPAARDPPNCLVGALEPLQFASHGLNCVWRSPSFGTISRTRRRARLPGPEGARALELTEAAPGAVGERRAKGRIQAFGAKWARARACPNYVRKWFGSGRIYSAPVALTSRGQPRGLPTDFASWGPDSAPHRFHAPGSVAQGRNGASRSVHSCPDARISFP